MQVIQAIATEAVSQGQIIFTDTFEDNTNDWIVGIQDNDSSGTINRTIDAGTYYWELSSRNKNIVQAPASINPVNDFYLSIDVTILKGVPSHPLFPSTDYGLTFREDMFGNYYYFGINLNGICSFRRYYNNYWTDIVRETCSPAITIGETNRLTVIARGNQFFLFNNDQFVAEAYDKLIKNGKFAIAASLSRSIQEVAVQFDNFILRTP